MVKECAEEATVCAYVRVSVSPAPSLTVTWIVHVAATPVEFTGAFQLGEATLALGENVPFVASEGHDDCQAYDSVWFSESLAPTLRAAVAADTTGLGDPAGACVMLSVCGTESTVWL
jgi:hypothetical protein